MRTVIQDGLAGRLQRLFTGDKLILCTEDDACLLKESCPILATAAVCVDAE